MPTMMRDAAISFPMLGDWSIDCASFTPSASHVLLIAARSSPGWLHPRDALLCAALHPLRHQAGHRLCDFHLDDPLAIIGARLYYVIFQWSDYHEHPLNAFKIWEEDVYLRRRDRRHPDRHHLGAGKRKIPQARWRRLRPGLLIGQCIGCWGQLHQLARPSATAAFSAWG